MSFSFEIVRKSLVDVQVGNGILSQTGEILHRAGVRHKAVIVTHDHVNELYGTMVKESLTNAGIKSVFVSIPAGESYKQWNTVARILPILQYEQLDRACAIGSLGGGVAGDLAGYLASIYLRGVKLFHLPTTLLAQVDSALGGKTGVNYQQHKNILGTYYQPCAIIADVDTVETLPPRELSAGMAEVIKTALLRGDEFLEWLEKTSALRLRIRSHSDLSRTIHMNRSFFSGIVLRCLSFKSQIVMQDELDFGPRQQLNLGHTFAHAFEGAGEFSALNHGEAVGLGLLCALRMSQLELGCDSKLEQRTRELLQTFDLPTTASYTYEELAKHLNTDKKRHGGKLRFIGLKRAGEYAVIDNPGTETIAKALEAVR